MWVGVSLGFWVKVGEVVCWVVGVVVEDLMCVLVCVVGFVVVCVVVVGVLEVERFVMRSGRRVIRCSFIFVGRWLSLGELGWIVVGLW